MRTDNSRSVTVTNPGNPARTPATAAQAYFASAASGARRWGSNFTAKSPG